MKWSHYVYELTAVRTSLIYEVKHIIPFKVLAETWRGGTIGSHTPDETALHVSIVHRVQQNLQADLAYKKAVIINKV